MSHHNKHEHTQYQFQPGRQESTEALAYQLWEQAGRPEGQAERFWGQAEERIRRPGQPATMPFH
jgi:hypothetical protein